MTNEQDQQPLDQKDLKIMALNQEISRLIDQAADMRVEITIQGQQLRQAQQASQENDVQAEAADEESNRED